MAEKDHRGVHLSLGEWSALQIRLHWIYEGMVSDYGRDLHAVGAPSFSAWLILAGRAEARGAGRVLTARAGDWLLPMLPPRRQRFSHDARILSVSFRLAWPSGELLFPRRFGFVFPSKKYPRLERAGRRLLRAARRHIPRRVEEFVSHPATLASYLRLQQHLPAWVEAFVSVVQALGCAPSRLGPTDERLLRAMHELDSLPMAAPGPRRVAAEAAGLSPSQLDRLFVAHFGLTPRAYLDRRKIEAACSALESSRTSIKEIGYRLGFKQPTHFTAWFRQHQGEAPRVYRATRIGRE
jgi:AraC-like DNA-binding protein